MSLSVGTVLYENESHYVHHITSQYECVVNCLWTAQCLRVTVPLVLFAYHSLAAWELNFRGLSHLKWKYFPGEDPGPPALVQVLPLKRGVGTPLHMYLSYMHIQETLYSTCSSSFCNFQSGGSAGTCSCPGWKERQSFTRWTSDCSSTGTPSILASTDHAGWSHGCEAFWRACSAEACTSTTSSPGKQTSGQG